MKKTCALLALSFIAAASSFAQDGQPQRPPPREGGPAMHRPPGPPPLIGALDANKDGKLDAEEIANASAALKKLDKNGDGQLTEQELFPPRPDGVRPEGRPGEGRSENRQENRPRPRPPGKQ